MSTHSNSTRRLQNHRVPLPPSQVELTAYHEAGHAVAYVLTGREVSQVSLGVNPGDGQCDSVPHAHTLPDPVPPDHKRRVWENAITVCLAGPVAEMMFLGVEDDLEGVALSDWDFQEVQYALGQLGNDPLEGKGSGLELALWFRWAETVDLLGEPPHWHAVTALARALRKRRSLTGQEVHAIIAKAFARRGARR